MRLFEEVEGLVFAKLKTIQATIKLVKLEAKLARLSIYPLLLNVVLLGLTSITIWLLCMLLIGYGATFLFQSIAAGLGLLLVINLGFLFGLFHYLKFNLRKSNPSFWIIDNVLLNKFETYLLKPFLHTSPLTG